MRLSLRRMPIVPLVFLAIAACALADEPRSIEPYLRVRHAFGTEFSPSADRIAFVTNTTGNYQAWTVPVAGGWPTQISFGEERVDGVWWSPTDPDTLIYQVDAGGNERTQLFSVHADGSASRDLTADPDHVYRFGVFAPDGRRVAYSSNKRTGADFDVYVLDLKTGKAARVFAKDGWCEAMAFSPDGRHLVVSRSPSNYDADLYLVDLKDRSFTHLTPHEGWATYYDVRWLPDGKSFYLRTDQGREFTGLALYDLKKKKLTFTYTPDADVEGIDLSKSGRVLAISVNEDGYSKVQLRNLGLTAQVFPSPDFPGGRLYGMKIAPDGTQVAYIYSDPAANFNVWVQDVSTSAVRQVTHASLGGVPPESFVRPEPVSYKSFDGLTIPAFLYWPRCAAAGGKVPVLVYMHGGPEAQERPDFSATFQYFLNQGFAIFAPNVRGSSGYGRRYLHADDARKRLDSVKDMIEGVRWLKTRPGVDADAVGLYGGSYGGYMVLAGLTEYPDEFAAGVSVVGIANFVTFLEKTGAYRRKIREAEYGSLETDRAFLAAISPLSKADRIKAPLMLIQGANDPRVPQHEADQMAEAIRRRGGVVEYLLYKDEGHGLSKLKNKLDAFPKMAAFLERYLTAKQ